MGISQIFMLCGGLALFLFGMSLMSDGFEKTAGDKLRGWLSILTNNRLLALIVGAGATAVIQSSSATTVMVVGFVNASLMTLKQAIGVIMGANVGTTVTGLIIAIKITAIAPVFLLIGVIMILFVKKRSFQNVGYVIAGFGMLFLGMILMSDSLETLKDTMWFLKLITKMSNPFLGLFVGVLLTAVLQSSSAFTGILLALAFQGLITMDAAFPLVLGSNIGTCITAVLASIGTNTNAKRAAFMHFAFNLMGTVLFLLLSIFISWPKAMLFIAGPETRWQISLFHVIFNVTSAAVLLPFSNKIVMLAEKLIPMREGELMNERSLRYVDERTFSTPSMIVPQLTQELRRMIELVRMNLDCAIDAFISMNDSCEKELKEREGIINFLNHQLTHLLVKAGSFDLSSHDRVIVGEMYHVITDLERIGDHAENIMEYIQIALENKLVFTQVGLVEIKQMSDEVIKLYDLCTQAFLKRDFTIVDTADKIESEIDRMEKTYKRNHIQRLNEGECNPHSSMMFTDLLTDLERVGDHSINMLNL